VAALYHVDLLNPAIHNRHKKQLPAGPFVSYRKYVHITLLPAIWKVQGRVGSELRGFRGEVMGENFEPSWERDLWYSIATASVHPTFRVMCF